MRDYDPEVSLAVRFVEGVEVASSTESSVDDDGLDEFLSSHGFEFVEGDRSFRRPTQDTDSHSDDEDSGAHIVDLLLANVQTMYLIACTLICS